MGTVVPSKDILNVVKCLFNRTLLIANPDVREDGKLRRRPIEVVQLCAVSAQQPHRNGLRDQCQGSVPVRRRNHTYHSYQVRYKRAFDPAWLATDISWTFGGGGRLSVLGEGRQRQCDLNGGARRTNIKGPRSVERRTRRRRYVEIPQDTGTRIRKR